MRVRYHLCDEGAREQQKGNLATSTDPAGRITTLTHDSAGNLIAIDAPDQTRTSFNYDAQHRMVQKRDARGQVSAYQFDSAGRLKKATLANGDSREIRPTELTGVPDLAHGSGVFGNPATTQQPPMIQATFKDAKGQTTTFAYDANGNVITTADAVNRSPAAICMKLGQLGFAGFRVRRLA